MPNKIKKCKQIVLQAGCWILKRSHAGELKQEVRMQKCSVGCPQPKATGAARRAVLPVWLTINIYSATFEQ